MPYKRTKEWFPFYVDDYLAETCRFNTHQQGVYLLLLLEYWRGGGPLKMDEDELCEISMIDRRTYSKVMPAILKKFEINGEYLHHKSMDDELDKYHKLQEKRREGGRLSAKKRWGSQNDKNQPASSGAIVVKENQQSSSSNKLSK